MTEYYIELQDNAGTYYGTTDRFDNTIFFEDLDDAKSYAQAQVNANYILARVVDFNTHSVVAFFQYGVK